MCIRDRLKDSAHIQEMEAEWKNRKARRAGRGEVEALYTMQDAEAVSYTHLDVYKRQVHGSLVRTDYH